MSSDFRLRERDINHDLSGGSYQSSVITTDGDEILSSDVGATTISYNENNNSSSSSNAVFFPPLSTRKPSANDEDRQRDEIAAYMRERISASVFEKTGFDLRQVLDARPIVVDPASSAMPSMTGSAGGSSLFMNSGAMRGIPSDMSAADNDELVARFAKLQKEHKRQLQQLQEQHSLLSSQVDPSLLSANSSMYSVDNAASGPVLGGAGMTPEQQDELKRRQAAQAQLAQLQQVKLLQAQLQQLQQLQLQSIKDASNNRQRPPFDPSFSANTTTPQTLSSRGSPRGRTAFSEEASGRHNVSGSSDDLADDELTMSQPKIGGSAGASFNYRGGGRSKGGSSPRRNRSKSAPKGSPRASDLAVPSTNPAGASPYSIPLSLEGAGGGPLKRGLSGSGPPPLSQLQQQEGYTSYASSTEFAPSDSERISSLKRPQMTLDGGAPVFIAPYISSAAESSDADLSSDDPSRKGRGRRSNPSSSTLTSVDTKKKSKQGKQSSAPSRALTVAQQKELLQQQAMQPLPPRPKTQSGLIPLQREWSTVVEQGDAKESSPYAMKPQLKVLVGERDVSAPLYHSSSVTASAGSTSSQHSLHSGHVVDAEILGAQSTHNVTTTFSAPSTAPLNQTTPLMTRQLLSTPVAAATRPQSDMHLENDPLSTPGGGVGAKKSEGDVFMTIGSHARRTAEQSLAPPPGMVQIPGAQPGIFQKDLSVKPETNSRPSSRSSERQPILMSSLPPALQGRVRYSLNAQLSAEEVLYARQQLEEYARMALQTKSRSTSPNELSMREFSERGFPTSGEQSENSYGRSGSPVNHLRDDLSGSAPVHAADLDNASKAPEDVFAEASEVFTESNKASSQHGPGVAAFLSSEFNRSGGAGGSFSAVPESILLSGGESRFSFAGGSDSAPTLNDGSSGHFPSRSPHRSHSPSKTSVINKAGFSPLQSSIIMNAMPIGIYSTTESRSRPSLSFGKASRKAWGKVSSPNSSILPIKRVGANGRLDSYASILLESNGGKFLTQEAEETFGHLLQPYPSLVSVGSSQEDEDDYDNIDDDERLTNPFASTEKITKTGQIVRSANLQLELEAAVRAAAAKATEDNHGVLPDGFVESVERKFLADQKQLKVERKAMLAKHRAAATDRAIAEATALQTLPSSSVSIEHSQRISHLVGPKRSTVINSASMSSSLAAAVATGSSGASVGSSTGTPTSRTTQSTKRSLDPSDPDYHYDFNSSLRSDGPLMHTNKMSSAKRPNTTGHPLLSGASVSARQYNPRTGGVSDVSKPNAQMQALLMSAKRGRDGILSSSLGGGGLAASRALRSQGGTSLTDQPPTVKEAWGSSTMTKPIISIQDSITLQRALAAEGRDTIANSASTKTPRSQAGVRGQFREKMGADPNVAAGPSSYPNAGTQALTATKKRAARVGGFDQMSGRPPMLEEINGPLQPAPNKYLMKSMGDLKSMRDLPMNVGFGYGLRSMDKEEKQRNSDSGQVLAYDITLADSQTLPTSPKLTIQSRAAWDTAENAANARQAMLDVAMKSTRIDYDSAIAAAASTTASVAEYKQIEDERMTNISLKLTSLSGGASNGLALPEKKLDDGELKKDSTSTSGSPVQSVGALTTTDILRAAQFELLLAERNGDFTAAMDAFFSSVSKPAIQIQAAPKTSEQKKAPWQIALASGGGHLPTTPRSLAGEQLIDASLVLSPTGSLFNSSSMATPGTIRRELKNTNNNNAFDRSGFVLSPGMEASIESQVLSPLFSNSNSGGDESRSTPSPSSGEGSPRKRFVRPGAAGTNASSRQRRPSEGKKIEEGKLEDTNVDGSGANPGQASSQEVDGLGFHFHRFAPDSEEDAGKGLDGDNFDASTINSSSRPGTSAAYPYFTSDGGYAFADGPMPNAMPSSRSGLRVPENIPKADVLLMTAETTASSNAKYSGVNADSLYSTPPDTAATALGEVSWIERAEASIKSSSGMNPLLATLLSKVEPAEIANVHKLLIAASAFENQYEPSVGEPYLSMRLNLNHLASDLVQVGDDDDSSELVYFSVCEVETASVSFNSKNSRSVRSEFALQLSDKSEGLMGEPRALNRRRLFQSVAVAPSPSFSSSEMSVHWPEMSMPLKTLSGAFPVLVEIWAVRRGRNNPFNQSADQSNEMIPGQRLLYHTNSISVADLQSASLAEDGSKLVHFSVVKGVSSINFNDPELSVTSITSHKAPSFGDYTSAGLRVNAVVAVDYSAGNAIRRLLLGAEVADAFEVQRVMSRKTAIKSARRSAQRSAKQRRESGVNGKSDDTASLENLPLALQAPTLLLSLPLIDVDDGSLHDAAGCTHPEATEMVAAAISLKEKRQASRAIKNHEIIDNQKMTIKVPPTTPIENLLLAASGKPSRMVSDGENSKMSINIDILDDLLLTASGLGSSPSTKTDHNKVVSGEIAMKQIFDDDSLGGVELDPYAAALAVLHEAIAPLLSLTKAQEKHKAAAQTLQAGFDLTSSLTLSPPGSTEGSMVLGADVEGGRKVFQGRSNPLQAFGFGATLRSKVYLTERSVLVSHNKQRASKNDAPIDEDRGKEEEEEEEEEEDGDDAEVHASRPPVRKPPTYDFATSLSTASSAASASIEAFVNERNIERSAAVRGEQLLTQQQGPETADVYWDEAMAFLFPLTDPAEFEADPSAHSSSELLEAYCRSSRMVKPALFRHFAPAIERAMFYAGVGGTFSQENQHYTVLFILTAGGPDDVAEATEALLEASLLPVSIVVIGLTPQSDDEIADAALLRSESANGPKSRSSSVEDFKRDDESLNADTVAAQAAISEAYTNEPPPLASMRQLCERLGQLQASEVTPIRGHVEFVSLSLKSLKDAAVASIAAASDGGATQTPELQAVRLALTRSVQRAVSKAVSFIPEHVVEYCQQQNVVPFHMPTFPSSSQQDQKRSSDEEEEFQSFGDYRGGDNEDEDDDDDDEIDNAVAVNTAAAARAGLIDPSALATESVGERPSRSSRGDRPRTVTFAGGGEAMGGLDDADTKPPVVADGSPIKDSGDAFLVPPVGVASPLLSPTALSLGTIDLMRNNYDSSGAFVESEDLMVQKVLAAQVLGQQKFLEEQSSRGLSTEEQQLQFLAFLAAQQEDLVQQAQALGLQLNLKKSPQSRSSSRSSPSRRSGSSARNDRESDNDRESSDDATWKKSPTAASRMPIIPGSVLLPPRARSRERKSSPSRHQVSDSDEPASSADDAAVPRYSRRKRRSQTPRLGEVTSDYISEKTERDKDTENLRPETPHTTALIDAERSVPPDVVDKNARAAVALAIVLKNKGEELRRPSRRSKSPTSKRGAHKKQQQHQPPSSQDATGLADEHGSHTNENNSAHVSSSHRASSAGHFNESSHNNSNDHGHHGNHGHNRNDSKNDHHDLQLSSISTDHLIDGRRSAPHSSSSGPTPTPSSHAPSSTVVSPTTEPNFSFKSFPTPSFNAYDAYLERIAKRGDQVVDEVDLDDLKSEDESDNVKKNREEREMLEQITRNVIKRIKTRDQQMEDMKRNASEDSKKFVEWETPLGRQLARRRMRSALAKQIERERKQRERAALARAGKKHHDDDSD